MFAQTGCRQLKTGAHDYEGDTQGPDLGGGGHPELLVNVVEAGITNDHAGQQHPDHGRQVQTWDAGQ